MNDKNLHLEIVTPDKTIYTGDVKSFTAPGVEGSFQILPRHAPFISTIQPGKVKIVPKDGNEIILAASGGVVEVHQNKITFLAEAVAGEFGLKYLMISGASLHHKWVGETEKPHKRSLRGSERKQACIALYRRT